jgi:hypothetical protein
MAKTDKGEAAITPEECISRLPELPLDTSEREADDALRRAELRQAVLAVAGLDHVSESKAVRVAVQNALNELPGMDE